MVVNGQQFISHLVPSGILQGKTCVIGNGLVVDPEVLLGEIDYLTEKGVDAGPAKLKISEKAHVIMPYHKAVDHARELMKGDKKIGTTGRGIGPCYEDKATRRGVRFVELLDADVFEERVRSILDEKNFYLKHYLKAETVDPDAVIGEYLAYAERLRPYVDNVSVTIDQAIKAGRRSCSKVPRGPIWTSTTAPIPL
jgi:adenylosuccinate synthase